jgi:adenylate cyclase
LRGYSRLMGANEEGTLERLKALRRELVDPKIAEHKGRTVKTTGDGVLVEFASVVDAVRCAVAVQQAMPERNTGFAADNRIELRIGINLGDVIVEGDDLRDEQRTSVARSSNRIPVDFGELHSAATNQLGGDPADPVRGGSAVVLPGL